MEVVIIGLGGLAKEIYGMLDNMGDRVVGFIAEDTGVSHPFYFCGLPVLGFDSWFVQERACDVVIANGSPRIRRKIQEFYQSSPHRFPFFIHPAAVIFGNPMIGGGSTVMPGGVIQPGVKIGRYCHINMGVTIGHDSQIGDYSVVNHNAGISGNVKIGQGVLIGCGAFIREGLTIGDGATVGMGAVVVKDVPAGETWVGNPARPLNKPGWPNPVLVAGQPYGQKTKIIFDGQE